MKNIDVEIVGKTGTTEKYIPEKERAIDGKYVSSFAAIFPYENPKYVLAITFDEPDPNNYYGGTISAPLVKSFVSYLKELTIYESSKIFLKTNFLFQILINLKMVTLLYLLILATNF